MVKYKSYTRELLAAVEAAQKCAEIQLERQNSLSGIQKKEDLSPVTEVDKSCETIIKDYVLSRFPQDGFLGEETASVQGSNRRIWIVDPLDGTRPYIKGIPTFSILIALEEDSVPVVGVINLPGLKEVYTASAGNGAFCNGRKIHVSKTDKYSDVMGSQLGYFEESESCDGKKLLTMIKEWDYHYGFMDAYSYMCVASGKLDVCVSLIDKPWDRAAAACIIKEAGGEYSDLCGISTIYNKTFIVSNSLVHKSSLEYFKYSS